MHDIVLNNLKIHHGTRCLIDLDIRIAAGEIVTIMGQSGSGKSTLLLAMIGALPAEFRQSGEIFLAGESLKGVPTHKRGIGILFQDDILFPHMSVGENLVFALPPHVKNRAKMVAQALVSADLAGFEARDPATLSGGQRARVALMRSLLAQPKALLLDEPFSRLDADLRVQIRDFVFDLVRKTGVPTLLVTHDYSDALAAKGRVLSPLGACLSETAGP